MGSEHLDAKQEFSKMKKEIERAGGMLYQYRACRRDESTIYDIENIRHNVAFSQTPLNMNDPFDSQIGFSKEKIYDELISMALDALPGDESAKRILGALLKYRMLGEMAEFISSLNELKKSILAQRKAMHKEKVSLDSFCKSCFNNIYNKMPKELKNRYSKEILKLFSVIVSLIEDPVISEENIASIIGLDKQVSNLINVIVEMRDNLYLPSFTDFLSKLKVSCFSSSGWCNTLMWAHYANSFSGFCIEYNFNSFNKFIGFIKKVKYSKLRPNVMLKDLGVGGIRVNVTPEGTKDTEIVKCDFDINKVFEYLVTKDECWKYEDEWRIINVTEDTEPYFIEMPKITSVTFGVNMDPLCRQLLWDVCNEKEIPCFELVLGKDNFSIDRRPLSTEDFVYDFNEESNYVNLLAATFTRNVQTFKAKTDMIEELSESGTVEVNLYSDTNKYIIDAVTDIYFLKTTVNRIFRNYTGGLQDAEIKVIQEAISSIEGFITAVQKIIGIYNELLPKILFAGKATLLQYLQLDKQKMKMVSLVNKILSLKWPDAIL